MALVLTGDGQITADNFTVATNGNTSVGGTLGVTGATTNTGLITASAGVAIGGTGAVNTLDDYEEGTFTPTVTFGGASVGVTYSTYGGGRRIGQYTKIGNLVEYFIHMEMTSKGSSTGGLNITGLPFTVVGSQHYIPGSVFIQAFNLLTDGAPVFRATTGSTVMDCYAITGGTYSQISANNCTNTSGWQINGKYYAS